MTTKITTTTITTRTTMMKTTSTTTMMFQARNKQQQRHSIPYNYFSPRIMYRALPYFIESFLFHALLAHRCLSYRLAPVRQLSPVYTFQPKHRPDGPLHFVLLKVLAKIRRSFVRQVAQPEKRLLQVVKLKR